MKLLVCAFLSGCGVLLIVTAPAYAYLDPGSGSMLLQILLGGTAGLAVIVKLYWHRILAFLRIRKPQPVQTENADPLPQADSDTVTKERGMRDI